MKNLLALIFLAFLLQACNQEEPAPITCPECYDSKMECIEGQCECPEGSIEIYHNLINSSEPDSMAEVPRLFCIKPDKLTFIANLEKYECIDTFGVSFLEEPYDGIQNNLAGHVVFEHPFSSENLTFPQGFLSVDTADHRGRYVGIYILSPTYGRPDIWCRFYDEETQETGTTTLHFRGFFVHPDTIRGYIEVASATGVKASLLGDTVQVDLIRTVPY